MAGDALWNSVSLAMHMDGANNGTTFTCEKGRAITRTGAVTKTGMAKCGTASGFFDGSSYLEVAGDTSLNLGTSDFCIEAWIMPLAVNNTRTIFCQRDWASSNGLTFAIVNGVLSTYYGAVSGTVSASVSLSNYGWTHVAMSRSGSSVRLFVDGTQRALGTWSSINLGTSTKSHIGARYSSTYGMLDPFSGFMDEVRITKGSARYTSDFTPSSDPFVADVVKYLSGTVKDSSDTFAARTVKIFRSSDAKYGGSVVSNGTTGAFSIASVDSSTHFAICEPFDSTENALILNNLTPV